RRRRAATDPRRPRVERAAGSALLTAWGPAAGSCGLTHQDGTRRAGLHGRGVVVAESPAHCDAGPAEHRLDLLGLEQTDPLDEGPGFGAACRAHLGACPGKGA